MGVIAKYKFNQNLYENFIPTFNDDFTNYTVTDEIGTDGFTVRTIESDSLPTSIRFGDSSSGYKSTGILSLLKIDYVNIHNGIKTFNDFLANARNLISVNTNGWNTSNITNMCNMFRRCSSLTSLDVSNFDTSQVTDMSNMFRNCSSLTSLDLSNFNTNQVNNMSYIFYNCKSLTSLDVSNFNTSQVTNMDGMFNSCSSLTSLNISNFDTRKLNNTYQMFYNCSKLTSLDVSSFNTSQVTNMNDMFSGCSSLTSLDVSNFDTSQVTNMVNMFSSCSSLTSLDVSNFNTSKVTSMSGMFLSCSSLTSLDVSNFDTSQVTDMSNMFRSCSSLTSLNISNFNTSKVTTMSYMFLSCKKLTLLDVSNFNTSQVTNMDGMFFNCSSLISLDVSNFDTSKLNSTYQMFYDCSKLTSLDVSSFNTSQVTNMNDMFSGCSSLTSLDLSNFNTSQVTDMNAMFTNIKNLVDIGMIYCNADTINKTSSSLLNIPNTKIYYSLPDISELEPHDNIEYVKYIFSTKIQLPPHIQLHSLPDGTCDELDIKTGILTRNIGCAVLDGSEDWSGGILYTNTYRTTALNFGAKKNSISISPNGIKISLEIADYEHIGIDADGNVRLFLLKEKLNTISTDGFKSYLSNNPITLYYTLKEPKTEKLILNYNNSCNYGVILPRGTSNNYNVITNEYKQNLGFIPIDGSIAFDTATIKDTTVKFSVAISKFEVDTTNVRGSDGIYCDNDLFKYEVSDNDYEHAYIENDTTLHIYVNKSRLSSYDQVGFQLYLTNNPFNLYYAMRTPIISYVNYEDLDPEKASWEMLDCMEDGSIAIESGNMDKTLLLDCMDYIAPTKNRFEIDLLKANTQYTVYAEGVNGRIQLNFGGNIVNFTSGNVYTSGETQLVEFYTDNEIKNLIIIEGDTRTETIEFFEGLKSSENVTVISSNAPFVFGKGGKIQ